MHSRVQFPSIKPCAMVFGLLLACLTLTILSPDTAVADELRHAAASADTEKEGLLRLANTFERHSKPGDLS